jgi:hypothetical protein
MTYTTRPARTSGPGSRPGDPLPPGTPERTPDGALRMAPTGIPDDPHVAPPDAADIDLFAEVGGAEGVAIIAADLQRRLRADVELAPLVDHLDDDEVADMEVHLVTLVLGGPVLTDTTSLLAPLRDSGVVLAQVRRLTGHLLDALRDHGMPPEGVDEVVGRVTVVVHEALDIPSESS